MSSGFTQNLPDLAVYRRELVAAGAPFPLPPVPRPPGGLLAALPPPPADRRGWPWDRQTESPAAGDSSSEALAKEDWPRITIVTPSFAQGAFLEETLRSVLLQNYPNLEFVVLDAGSKDESPEIIRRYRPWLSYARVAPDRGQSHAVNLGFSLGSGRICGWLNSDDFYLPGTLQRVAEAWKGGAEFIYGDGIELNAATGRRRVEPPNPVRGRFVRFAGLVVQPTTFWSADRHQPVWEEQQCSMDYELWIRLLPGLRTRRIPRPLAVARRHDAAKTRSPAMTAHWQADARRNGLAHPEVFRPGLGHRLTGWEFRAARRLIRAWDRRGLAARLDAVRRECGWDAPIEGYDTP